MTGSRILIVEDETIVALDIKKHLEKYGYVVPEMISSGEETLERIEALCPDLVLMDIKLQGDLDGVETARAIRERYRIPVVMLTAFADDKTVERAKITEPYGYIIKPFEEKELRTTIEMALYRHEMEKKLMEREHLFSTTLEAIADGVVVTDQDLHVQYLNPVAQRLIGSSQDECLGMKFGDLVIIHADQEASDGAFHQAELELSDDRRVPIELSSSPLWSDYSEPVGTVWVLHDISQRKELEDQLRQSQKLEAIGRLAGGVAHDFNNLLTVIMGYCNLILDTGDSQDGIRSDVEGIQNAAQRAVSLTRQLLAFSRHQVMKPRIIDVNNLILEMEKMIRRLITEDITMHFYLDATKSHVHVDPGQIEQVLINLAVNARDAMPDGGTLVIQTHNETLDRPLQTPVDSVPPGRYVVVTVRDTGVGIDGEILAKVFEPFFTTKEDGKGTGLGLSTVYGIVQQSGGYINVETSPGKGTSFSIYLTERSPAKEAEREGDAGDSQSRGNETILVVEDEDFVRTLVTKILSRKGYNVLEARNGGEALLICEQYQQSIDMLISDLVMPHMDGNKLAARLKQERPGIRLLLMSGYPDKTIRERGAPDPAIAFIHKPFNAETFGRKVREILDS